MKTDTADRILGFIHTNRQARAVDLVRNIGITNAAVHRQLGKLLARGEIKKAGKPPKVFYVLKEKEKFVAAVIPNDIREFMEKNYIYATPAGEFLEGIEGFTRWAIATGQEKHVLSLAEEYETVRNAANGFVNKNGWIDATAIKEQAAFGDIVVDKLLYKDFYSIEKFGKTKLGQMVLYAKTSQNIKIIYAIADQVKPVIDKIIKEYDIDTIGYIPPSVKRKVQFMSELRSCLQIQLPELVWVKAYPGDIVVPQKSLSKLQDRIVNARETIFADVNKSAVQSENVLLIDDAVGSGATLHETAKKVKEIYNPKGKIIAFAIVGSMKGFEVIKEI